MNGDQLRFLLVMSCIAPAFLCHGYASSWKDAFFLRVALLLTLAADFCLILKDFPAAGVLLFCLAQLAHIYRMGGPKAFGRLLLCVSSIFIWGPLLRPETLLLPALYAVFLLYALACAVLSSQPLMNKGLCILGMCAFVLCDIHVALYNLSEFHWYQKQAFFWIWIFYLPSQALLALSAGKFEAGQGILQN